MKSGDHFMRMCYFHVKRKLTTSNIDNNEFKSMMRPSWFCDKLNDYYAKAFKHCYFDFQNRKKKTNNNSFAVDSHIFHKSKGKLEGERKRDDSHFQM